MQDLLSSGELGFLEFFQPRWVQGAALTVAAVQRAFYNFSH
jgi:hypothetical protein